MEMASKISKEMTIMKRGLGEKVASALSSCLGFFLSMALGFYLGWLLGLIVFAAFPALIIVGSLMYAVFNTGAVEAMKAYAQSAGYAEQALQSIKVVHTYS
jgi:ABC-type bacteriocin/lantibiotic exporter with double-glycine peptidase domain